MTSLLPSGSAVHGPDTQGDGAVTTGGGVAILVPEEHAEVRLRIVRRDLEAAVHVGVAARLMAEQPADGVQASVPLGAHAALRHRGAGQRRDS
jgi:hypothetical protein